jgi:hypothetical protein
MAGAGHEDGVQIVFDDQPVEVDIGEGQPWTRPPVSEQALLDVFGAERLAQQRVVAQIDHAGGQVVAGAPVGVDTLELLGGGQLREVGGCGHGVFFCLDKGHWGGGAETIPEHGRC